MHREIRALTPGPSPRVKFYLPRDCQPKDGSGRREPNRSLSSKQAGPPSTVTEHRRDQSQIRMRRTKLRSGDSTLCSECRLYVEIPSPLKGLLPPSFALGAELGY